MHHAGGVRPSSGAETYAVPTTHVRPEPPTLQPLLALDFKIGRGLPQPRGRSDALDRAKRPGGAFALATAARGAVPLHHLQWSVVSGQWSVVSL